GPVMIVPTRAQIDPRRDPTLCAIALLFLLPLATPADQLPISPERLRDHIYFLASDELEGRGAGTHGDTLAALYIISELKDMGVQPRGDDVAAIWLPILWHGGYLQPFSLGESARSVPESTGRTGNIIGFIAGSDPSIDEIVVVGAHYDHV